MRKLILISAFAVASILASISASVSAQAGDRSLILAANDTPAATSTTAPATATATTEAKPEAVATDTARQDSKKQVSKPQKTHVRHTYEGDEAKARRIAARYGVYW